MKSGKLLAAGLAAASLLPAVAFGGTDSGFYVGAGVGQASVGDLSTEGVNVNFSADDTGWKVFGGYNFGLFPLIDIAVEGGYVDLGNPHDNVGGTPVKLDVNGYDLFGLLGGNLGPIGVFAKVGMVQWNADVAAGSQHGSDDGTDPAYGIGARLKFGSLEVRAEYEMFDVSAADNVYMLSASGVWTF